MTASIMAIPATIVIAKMLFPETEKAKNMLVQKLKIEADTANAFDAICIWYNRWIKLALNVGAMLISFLALLALVNAVF